MVCALWILILPGFTAYLHIMEHPLLLLALKGIGIYLYTVSACVAFSWVHHCARRWSDYLTLTWSCVLSITPGSSQILSSLAVFHAAVLAWTMLRPILTAVQCRFGVQSSPLAAAFINSSSGEE